jgi:hypothetical protein
MLKYLINKIQNYITMVYNNKDYKYLNKSDKSNKITYIQHIKNTQIVNLYTNINKCIYYKILECIDRDNNKIMVVYQQVCPYNNTKYVSSKNIFDNIYIPINKYNNNYKKLINLI